MTHHHNCLNCGSTLTGKFCASCGQKADTHRISFLHFLTHDLAHGVWHLDKGIPYTLRQLFTRPGYAAREYIAGKRVRYYNVFYLMLLIIGLSIFIVHYHVSSDPKRAEKMQRLLEQLKDGDGLAYVFIHSLMQNLKLISFSLIPLFAINGLVLFRRLKYNFSEQVILAGFALLGCSIIVLLLILLHLPGWSWLNFISRVLRWGIPLYLLTIYYQATKGLYRLPGFTWRALAFGMLLLLELLLIVTIFVAVLG